MAAVAFEDKNAKLFRSLQASAERIEDFVASLQHRHPKGPKAIQHRVATTTDDGIALDKFNRAHLASERGDLLTAARGDIQSPKESVKRLWDDHSEELNRALTGRLVDRDERAEQLHLWQW